MQSIQTSGAFGNWDRCQIHTWVQKWVNSECFQNANLYIGGFNVFLELISKQAPLTAHQHKASAKGHLIRFYHSLIFYSHKNDQIPILSSLAVFNKTKALSFLNRPQTGSKPQKDLIETESGALILENTSLTKFIHELRSFLLAINVFFNGQIFPFQRDLAFSEEI